MAKTSTTLSGAIAAGDSLVNVASKAAMRAGDNIVIGTETMKVLVADPVNPAVVYRGHRGTNGQAAAAGATVNYGPPSDWGPGVGVAMVPQAFEAEAKAEVAAEDAKELADRVEKKRLELEKKATEKAAADAKAAEKTAADKDKADKDKAAEPKPAAHR